MAKIQNINVPPGQEELACRSFTLGDRYTFGSARSHQSELSDERKTELREQSLFYRLAQYWRLVTEPQKAAWAENSAFSALTNWQAFISENAGRLRKGFSVTLDPPPLHTGNVGRVLSLDDSSHFLVTQLHPKEYSALRRIPACPWRSRVVTITENFSFPLTLRIRYLLDVETSGDNPGARYSARVTTSYQGEDIVRVYSINLVPGTEWREVTLTITGQPGYFVSYDLEIEMLNYTANLYFDNVEANHSGMNWARDRKCNDVSRDFVRGFSQVLPYWIVQISENIAEFNSDYFSFFEPPQNSD